MNPQNNHRTAHSSFCADGRLVLEQETNAYTVLPESQRRRGCRPPLEPPAPAAGTLLLGLDPAPMLSAAAQAALEGDLAGPLAGDPATIRQLPWRGSGSRSWHETPEFPGVHESGETFPRLKAPCKSQLEPVSRRE